MQNSSQVRASQKRPMWMEEMDRVFWSLTSGMTPCFELNFSGWGPLWLQQRSTNDDDLEVHVGRHHEMHTPRRQKPHREPGLLIGKLYPDGCLAASGTGTMSSAESRELQVESNQLRVQPTRTTSLQLRCVWATVEVGRCCGALLKLERYSCCSLSPKILPTVGRRMGSGDR